MVRPERVHLEVVNNNVPRTAGEAPIATVERVTFSGSSLLVAVRCAGMAVSAEVPNDDSVPDLSPGDHHASCRCDHSA
ncbi:MAG: TOBE domain-containing protein [Actinomycetota bacterium]